MSSTSAENQGKILLGRILNIFGLYHFSSNASFVRTIAAYIVITLAGFALFFEISANINNLQNVGSSRDGARIMHFVDAFKYWIKTAAVLAVLLTFFKKSAKMNAIMQELNGVHNGKTSPATNRKCLWLAITTIMTFLIYVIAMTTTRIFDLIARPNEPGTFPWFSLSCIHEELIVLVTRNYTEAIRIFCSGFLGILLLEFADGPAAQSSRILGTDFF
jgi:hypothetical protein